MIYQNQPAENGGIYDSERLFRQIRRHRQEAQEKGLPGRLTKHQWLRAIQYFRFKCAVCGVEFSDLHEHSRLTLDHWTPVSKGGATVTENVIPLCLSCNLSKNDHDAAEWLYRQYSPDIAESILARIHTYFLWAKGRDDVS